MVSIKTLVKIYKNFGEREHLSPLLSADEMLFEPNLTNKQKNWIERFIIVWDYTTNLDAQFQMSETSKKEGLTMAKGKKVNEDHLINNKKISQLTNNELAIEWQKRIEKYLLGKSIVKIEYMSEEDANKFGWSKRPIQILLSNGVWLTITQDDEGNNGGAIHTNIKKLEVIPVIN